MNADQTRALRREKDEFFKSSAYAPLSPEQQDAFDALRYYDYDPALDLTVTVEPFSTPQNATFETSTGDTRIYQRYGQFSFTVEGQPVTLTLYSGEHGYFLPFVDVNAGSETYPAGRYLEPEPLGGGRFHVDFNQSYNPYCAYTDGFSCPLTPAENRLNIAIRAGEMMPVGAWLELE